jgi:hypothetical protein
LNHTRAPFRRASVTSSALAANNASFRWRISAAIASSAVFFAAVLALAIARDAARAWRPRVSI